MNDTQYIQAGFTKRLIAYFIDIIPIVLFTLFVIMPDLVKEYEMAIENKESLDQDSLTAFNWTVILIWIGICIAGESSSWFASPGKKIVGIKVITINGETPNQKTIILRNMSKIISSLAFNVGYLWIIADTKKQSWHDKIARTFVVEDFTP